MITGDISRSADNGDVEIIGAGRAREVFARTGPRRKRTASLHIQRREPRSTTSRASGRKCSKTRSTGSTYPAFLALRHRCRAKLIAPAPGRARKAGSGSREADPGAKRFRTGRKDPTEQHAHDDLFRVVLSCWRRGSIDCRSVLEHRRIEDQHAVVTAALVVFGNKLVRQLDVGIGPEKVSERCARRE